MLARDLGTNVGPVNCAQVPVSRPLEPVRLDRQRRNAMRGVVAASLVWMTLVWLPGPTSAQTVGEVFRKVAPSVVVIRARGRDITAATGAMTFSEIGSGVLISADGKVMTAAHVVHAMDTISVEFLGGDTVPARVVGSEPAADLSLLQLERVPAGAPAAPLANSDTVQIGDPVVIVGAPYGLSYAVSAGLISARWAPNTVYRTMPLAEFFQTDAVINTGNSGGPMFNMGGEVIGIVSHNISKSGGSEGLGFVVTANTARELLLEKRSFWGGVEGQVLTDQQADILNLPPGALGYIVKTVVRGSPAEAVGLRGGTAAVRIGGDELVVGGDIILSIEGIPIGPPASFVKIKDRLGSLSPGSPFTLTVLRKGQVFELKGTIQ
jgi:S1-C subfamily serine protease